MLKNIISNNTYIKVIFIKIKSNQVKKIKKFNI